jgi:parallel beta-helix repeat protein
MSRQSLSFLRFLVLAALLLYINPVSSAPSSKDDNKDEKYGNKKVIRVGKGQSIQEAINRANSGSRIEVSRGEYREQLEITKDGITLIGKDAVLIAPDKYEKNRCTGLSQTFTAPGLPPAIDTNAGICIYSKEVVLSSAPYSSEEGHKKVELVRRPIKDVQVSGFDIRNFDGQNIALYGGKNVRISDNKLTDGGRYGFLTAGSKGTVAENNIVIGSKPDFILGLAIAMCMDDHSNAEFSNNDVKGYFIGLCTETSGGVNKGNKVRNTCLGNVIDPNVRDVKLLDNHISTRDTNCYPGTGAGIAMLGAIDAVVKGNKVEGFGKEVNGTGIFLSDWNGVTAVGNTVKKNELKNNDLDIFVNSTANNYVRNNVCALAVPENACK